jgi:hypothetical protein
MTVVDLSVESIALFTVVLLAGSCRVIESETVARLPGIFVDRFEQTALIPRKFDHISILSCNPQKQISKLAISRNKQSAVGW